MTDDRDPKVISFAEASRRREGEGEFLSYETEQVWQDLARFVANAPREWVELALLESIRILHRNAEYDGEQEPMNALESIRLVHNTAFDECYKTLSESMTNHGLHPLRSLTKQAFEPGQLLRECHACLSKTTVNEVKAAVCPSCGAPRSQLL